MIVLITSQGQRVSQEATLDSMIRPPLMTTWALMSPCLELPQPVKVPSFQFPAGTGCDPAVATVAGAGSITLVTATAATLVSGTVAA